MTLRINDDHISSDHTMHTARLLPGDQYAWEVSWLPGRPLDRNSAITAMVLADTAGAVDLHRGHRLWPFVQAWAAELSLSAPDALGRVSHSPGSDIIRKDAAADRTDPEAAGS